MTGETILIVEDEGLIAFHMISLLKSTGYRVLGAVDTGEMGLKMLENSPGPDLILMDIKLAGLIDGIETARQIRQRFSIPLIFVTAHTSEQMLERMQEVAHDGVIIKPFVPENLLALIGKVLARPTI